MTPAAIATNPSSASSPSSTEYAGSSAALLRITDLLRVARIFTLRATLAANHGSSRTCLHRFAGEAGTRVYAASERSRPS